MEKKQTDENQLRILKNLKDTKISVEVVMVRQKLPLEQLCTLTLGSILHLNTSIHDPAYLSVSDKRFAKGTVVRSGDKYGLQIDEILQ